MAREQSGICAEPNLHGFFILMNALERKELQLRQQISQLPGMFAQLSDQFSEANLNTVFAVGATYWEHLYPGHRPPGLQSLCAIQHDDIAMPVLPVDLCLYLRADRYDVLHLAVQQAFSLLAPSVELVEQLHVFRFMDGRDLTGFIDNPDAPRGRRRREYALYNKEPHFSGGSYMHFQRYRLDFSRWQILTQQQQEAIMGRSKFDGQLLPLAQRHDSSHAVRTAITGNAISQQLVQYPAASIASLQAMDRNKAPSAAGNMEQTLPLIFQNMPFGHVKNQGQLLCCFSSQPQAFGQWLKQRLGGVGQQNYDLLLDYMQADSGAAFFAPSIEFLESQGSMQF